MPFDTWHDVVDAARQVQEIRPGLAAYFGTGGTSSDRIFHWLTNFGVPFEGNIPDLTAEQGVSFIEWLQTMHEEGITNPEYVIGQQDESLGAFARGDLPILMEGLNGGGAFMDLEGFGYGEGWLTTPMPTHEEDGGAQMGVPRGWSLSAESEHPYEASLVLRYLMEPENVRTRYLELESAPMFSTELLESEELTEAQPFFTDEIMDIYLSLDRQLPEGTNTGAVGEVLADLLEEVSVTGTEDSPEDVAARYQEELDELRAE